MKITELENGINEIVFLDNILENGKIGQQFINKKFCFINSVKNNLLVCDDEKNPLFKSLQKLQIENNKLREHFSFSQKEYTYCLLNGEYVLLIYGYTLMNIIKRLSNFDKKKNKLIVKTSLIAGSFIKIDNHRVENYKPSQYITNDFLLKDKIHIEKYLSDTQWNSKKNYKKIYSIFKELGMEKFIKQLKNEQRKLKIQKIIKSNMIEVSKSTILEIKNIFEKNDLNKEILNELNDLLNDI